MAQPDDDVKKEALELIEGLIQEHDMEEIRLPIDFLTSMKAVLEKAKGDDHAA